MVRAPRVASASGIAVWAPVALATPPADVTVSATDFNGDGVVDIDDYYIQDANDGLDEAEFEAAETWAETVPTVRRD